MIETAIHGCGKVAREHAKAIIANPHARVRGLSSRTRASAEALRDELGLDCVVYPDYEAVLADDAVAAVSICTPNHEHTAQAIAAAQAGKHLILEKPVGTTLDELRDLRAAVRQAGITSVVSFVLRWNKQCQSMKQVIESGGIGEIVYGECDYWHGIQVTFPGRRWICQKQYAGGAMTTGGCHAVDMLRHLVGEIEEVSAYARDGNPHFDYPTTLVASLRYANGAIGKVSCSLDYSAPYAFNLDLLGTEGTLRDNRVFSRKWFPGQLDYAEIPTIRPDSGAVEHHPFQEEIDHFVDCVLAGRDCEPNIEDGIKTQEVCVAIERSAEEGRAVRLPLPALSRRRNSPKTSLTPTIRKASM